MCLFLINHELILTTESLLSLIIGRWGEKASLFQGSQSTSQIVSYGWQKEGNNFDNDSKLHCKTL